MTNKIPLLVIVGPTAIGKTDLSIKIAKELNGEIISADSMQIYKYMDIGTAKITKDEMEGVPHYLIDNVAPDEDFSVSDFKRLADFYVYDIHKRNKLPIIVGGTGLYINSLVYDLDFTAAAANLELREKFNILADNNGNDYIYEELRKVDESSADRINPNDRKRIIRALEVFYETGKPMSDYYKNFRKLNDKYNIVMLGLNMDREKLYDRINKRVDKMIDDGLLNEVNNLVKMGYDEGLNSMQALGYKEIISYYKGNISLEEAIDLIKKNSRKYAKRQLTWFRRDNRIKWIYIDEYDDKNEVCESIVKYIKEKFENNN